MKIFHQFDVKSPVHTLKLLDDGRLGVIDTSNAYRVYDLDSYKLVDGFKSSLPENILYVNNMAIAPDGRHLALYNKEKKEVSAIDSETRKITKIISNHPNGVETVEFANNSKYFITGGMEGRLYMWNVDTGKKVDSLSHHADTITAISSDAQGRWIATAGYDRVIKVFNRSFRRNHYKLISHKKPITTVNFLSKQRVLSTDREGTILIWDIVKSSVKARLPKFNSHITAVCFDENEEFLFVAGLNGMVGLYDLKTHELLKMDFLKQLSGITEVTYCNQRDLLIFALANGQITVYALKKEEEKFLELMHNKEFDACYKMEVENPLLGYSNAYKNLEALFEKAYSHAKELLRVDKKEEAKELLKHFASSSAKRLLIQKIFNDFELYSSFSKAIRHKKYMMAYSLAEEYSALKETAEYAKMEDEWNRVLLLVRSIDNEKVTEEKIQQLFKPFMGIPGKNLIIKSIYANRNVFVLFRKFLKEKNFFHAFKLAAGHPFLKELDEYVKLLKIGKTIRDNTMNTFNEGHYYDAVKLSEILSIFPAEKEFAEELKLKANVYAEAMHAFAEKKFSAVYNMIEEYPFLEEAQIAIDIEVHFFDTYEKAENYAASGNVAAVLKVMEKFSVMKSKQPAVVHLVKIAYWAQIEQAAKAKASDKALKNAFEKYQDIFGYDSMLEDLLQGIQQFRALKIDLKKNKTNTFKGSVDTLKKKII